MPVSTTLITAAELAAMGDIGRCELIRGELIRMSPTKGRHGTVAMKIGSLIEQFVEARKPGEVLAAETGFLIEQDPDTVRAPDAAFVAKHRVPPEDEQNEFWPLAPDLCVEVLSSSDTWSEVEEKVEEWLRVGSRLVWAVDPKRRKVHVYHPFKQIRVLAESDTLEGNDVLPGFAVRVADLFK